MSSPETSSSPVPLPANPPTGAVPIVDVTPEPDPIQHLTEAEVEEMLRLAEEMERARKRRDRLNAIAGTLVLHGVLILGMSYVVLSMPSPTVPSIVATASVNAPTPDQVEQLPTMEKPTVDTSDPVKMAMPDIISAEGASAISILSTDAAVPAAGVDVSSIDFAPSMALGMSDGVPMTLFGQKLDTAKLGVILDVSGSMAEFLPDVIREVDKNFRSAPIVYVTNALIQQSGNPTQLVEIVPSEVIPYYEDAGEYRRHTPYWFLWHDLPRMAPQRYVDRLIQIFKTRKNSFLAYGGHNRIGKAVEYLASTDCESVYIFSDFEDYIDETLVTEMGKLLSREKIKGFLQPALTESANLPIVDRFIAKRTLGRTLPPLVQLLGPSREQKPTIALKKPEPPSTSAVKYATPRDQLEAPKNIWHRHRTDWEEIARLDLKEYTLVFYGPEARADIFIKDAKGQYIQYPIIFSYHSWKYIDDGRVQPWRWRKWLRNQEPPKWDGKELVWKMVLEDELKFDVYVYLNDRGMHATYTADPPSDGHGDNAFVYFRFPHLATERADKYYGYDFPKDGVELETIRLCVHPNTVTFNLPNQFQDQYAKEWKARGFEPGLNKRHYDGMIRSLPDGIRDVEVEGPSFGIRKFHARTTSGKVLLSGGSHRNDFELWEGFHCQLVRPGDTRTRFTKTEAIMIEIE